QPIESDASFRRYFRLRVDGRGCVLMDAPPPNEDVRPFCDINARLLEAGLKAPEILRAEHDLGFLLLEDLGDTRLRSLIDKRSADLHFNALFGVLRDMALKVDHRDLPAYDRGLLQMELDLFPDWYLAHHRPGISGERFEAVWNPLCEALIESATTQRQCFVHRDFHSCNLLLTPRGEIGIIDFQDAVAGPVSYDLVSLLWDRYIRWPRQRLEQWIHQFAALLELDVPAADWLRSCDLMGLQRNLKIVGIFARLHYRDGKRGYLEMIPRFYGYLLDTLQYYPEFGAFRDLLEQETCAP
ncbi:MAG: phosphotransferase, partial [Lysobacterales bacterium]